MKKTIVISFLLFLFSINLYSLDWGLGIDQWTRYEKTENTFILAPGAEVYFSLFPLENLELRLSTVFGSYFGTVAGGTLQGNYYFKVTDKGVWRPGIGMGFFCGYIDQIFFTESSRNYIVPYELGIGLELNLVPFHFVFSWGTFSALDLSLGVDLSDPTRKTHMDLRLCRFTFFLNRRDK